VLNLGVEGMMLMGAVTGYAVTTLTGNPWLGLLAGCVAGALMSALFGVLTLLLLANQVATGLSLTIFGIGLSAYIGKPYTSASIPITIAAVPIPGLSQIPVIGPAIFSLTPVDYLTFALFVVVGWFLYRTRAGLVLRAVGESPGVAHSVGHPVLAVRFGAVLFGGAMAGLAGGYYTIINLHIWQENITTGGVRDLASGTSRDWRAAVRHRHGPPVLRPGVGYRHPDAMARDVALSCNSGRAGRDFAQSEYDQTQFAGVPRQAVLCRELTGLG
jgi:ABC-type uncharacterized transport system permease subunit